MQILHKVVAALRDPRIRRLLLWRARRVMTIAVVVIETMLRESTDAIVMVA